MAIYRVLKEYLLAKNNINLSGQFINWKIEYSRGGNRNKKNGNSN